MNIQSFKKKVLIGIGIMVVSLSGCTNESSKNKLEQNVKNEVAEVMTQENETLNR